MKSKKTKPQIYRDAFSLFVKSEIPDSIFNGYMNDGDGKGTLNLQEWIVNNLKPGIDDWCTGIGIIESVENLYKVAVENSNVEPESEQTWHR